MKDCPRARVDIRSVDLGSELIVYDERTRQVHVLNPTARRIWQLCDGTHQIEDIVAEIARLFPQAPVDTVESDVRSTLDELDGQGVVVWTAVENAPHSARRGE